MGMLVGIAENIGVAGAGSIYFDDVTGNGFIIGTEMTAGLDKKESLTGRIQTKVQEDFAVVAGQSAGIDADLNITCLKAHTGTEVVTVTATNGAVAAAMAVCDSANGGFDFNRFAVVMEVAA